MRQCRANPLKMFRRKQTNSYAFLQISKNKITGFSPWICWFDVTEQKKQNGNLFFISFWKWWELIQEGQILTDPLHFRLWKVLRHKHEVPFWMPQDVKHTPWTTICDTIVDTCTCTAPGNQIIPSRASQMALDTHVLAPESSIGCFPHSCAWKRVFPEVDTKTCLEGNKIFLQNLHNFSW